MQLSAGEMHQDGGGWTVAVQHRAVCWVARIRSEVLLHEAHTVHCLCNPETRRLTVQGWHKMIQENSTEEIERYYNLKFKQRTILEPE